MLMFIIQSSQNCFKQKIKYLIGQLDGIVRPLVVIVLKMSGMLWHLKIGILY